MVKHGFRTDAPFKTSSCLLFDHSALCCTNSLNAAVVDYCKVVCRSYSITYRTYRKCVFYLVLV